MIYRDNINSKWNNVYDKFKGKRVSVWKETATSFFANKVDYLRYKNKKYVLDAGCGDGRNILPFARNDFKIVGFDISSSALERSKKIFNRYPNVSFQQGLLEECDKYFKPISFDVIICDFVLVHIKQARKVINRFYKLLKKGGYAILEFTSVHDPHCGQGKKVGRNAFIQHGMFLKFYTLKDVEEVLKKFKILIVDASYYSNPPHGSGYRNKRHIHHSYFVLAQKG